MVSFSKRLELVFESLTTTPYKFAGEHGFGRASLFNMVAGRSKPNLDMLERICEAEPRISAEYLLRGTGSPLRDSQIVTDLATADGLEAFKQKMVAVLDQQIQELRETRRPS